MGRYICHHEGFFFEWSTVVDAPVTYAMPREEFEQYYREEYGRANLYDFEKRMERAVNTGTSAHRETLADLIRTNRAGPRDGRLSFKALLKMLHDRPEEDDDDAAPVS